MRPGHEEFKAKDPGPRNLQTLIRGLDEPVKRVEFLESFDETRYREWKSVVERSINDMTMLWPFFVVA